MGRREEGARVRVSLRPSILFLPSVVGSHRLKVFSSLTLPVEHPLKNTMMRRDKTREITRIWGA
jgi:hypothetical protein